MASEKSISVAMMLTTLLLMVMYSSDVALASLSACELGCHASCLPLGSLYKACYLVCVRRRCHHVVVPTLDPPRDPVSDPLTQCKMECISSKCMDSPLDVKKTAGCVSSCSGECDQGIN